jgi:hypothetical protein
MHTAIFFAPETGPKSLVGSKFFVGSMVRECWITANIALGAEHPAARQKGDETDS